MEPSILKSIKKLLGLPDDYTAFDEDALVFINGAFSSLSQFGVVSIDGVVIEDETKNWDDLNLSDPCLQLVKPFVFLKAKMTFDPPATSFLIEAYERQIAEYEGRLLIFHDQTAEETYADDSEESEVSW